MINYIQDNLWTKQELDTRKKENENLGGEINESSTGIISIVWKSSSYVALNEREKQRKLNRMKTAQKPNWKLVFRLGILEILTRFWQFLDEFFYLDQNFQLIRTMSSDSMSFNWQSQVIFKSFSFQFELTFVWWRVEWI